MKISSYEYIIKKSKFIGILYQIKNKDDIKIILDNLYKEHKNAKHFPYAFILENTAGKTDDKEPHNSAGIQIYNALTNNHLNNHLLVIIRYFGGTKLGSSNLLRTYALVANTTIKIYQEKN